MTINYYDHQIELKYTFRAYIIYENIVGDTFRGNGMKDVIIFMYSILVASDPSVDNFDKFVDWLDENPTVIEEFSEWLTTCMKRNNDVRDTNVESDKKEEEDKTPKK